MSRTILFLAASITNNITKSTASALFLLFVLASGGRRSQARGVCTALQSAESSDIAVLGG